MNEDFGVGRRRRVTNLDVTPRPAAINIDKYQPASRIGTDDQSVAMAVAAYDRVWDNSTDVDESLSTDEDLANYNADSLDDGSISSSGGSSDGGSDDTGTSAAAAPGGKNPFRKLVAFLKSRSRKQWLITGGIVLILAAGLTSFLLLRGEPSVTSNIVTHKKKAAEVKPTSPLTGLETSEEDTKRPVIGAMIENSTFARPQSGLKDAGVVYEAIAEAGITRFLALYQEANPGNIGPVRSARPYYIDWAHSYDAGYAHVGGSPEGLTKIKADGVRDLDQFANGGSYHRISQREAPHNVYTSMQTLRDLMKSKGFNGSTFSGFARKKEAPAKAPTANSINIAISGPTYNVHYDYDAASNSYQRTMGGAPHTDADSGTRLAPKVVIGLATQYSTQADAYHSSYNTTGSGAVKIFQDGTVTEGTWKREGNDVYKFYDAKNQIIKLDPGQTWITVVGDPGAITYTAPAPTPAPAAKP